jgi:hypothetical protein
MKSTDRIATIPNPTPLFFLVAATLTWFLLWKEDPDSIWLLALFVLACSVLVPASVYALAMRPEFAISLLFVAVAMPRWAMEIAGLKARPEHIVCGLLLLALPYWIKRRKDPLVWMTADYLLLAYLAMNFFSSIFMSMAPSQTIKWCVQQTIVVLPYLKRPSQFFASIRTCFSRLNLVWRSANTDLFLAHMGHYTKPISWGLIVARLRLCFLPCTCSNGGGSFSLDLL